MHWSIQTLRVYSLRWRGINVVGRWEINRGLCIYVPCQPQVGLCTVQGALCSILCLDRVWDEVITSLIRAGRLPQALLLGALLLSWLYHLSPRVRLG